MLALLTAGFLLGLRHALEPDHLAVVSALAARRDASRDFLRHGLVWAAGHSTSLLLLAAAVLSLGGQLPAGVDRALHGVVALLLLLLGIATLRNALWPERAAATAHQHALDDAGTGASPARGRTLLIGLVQGLAGSGALVLLALDTTGRPAYALGYVAVFGLGSILGMALVALLLSVPLARATRQITGFNRWLSFAAALLMIAVGVGALRAL